MDQPVFAQESRLDQSDKQEHQPESSDVDIQNLRITQSDAEA